MSLTTRHAFTDAFKREAVSLLEGSGRPLTQVAMELGIPPSMLRSWRGRQRAGLDSALTGSLGRPGAMPSTLSMERAEIRRLRKKLERAQMERNILKKRSVSSRARRPAGMKFRCIEDHREVFLVRVMCAVLAVSPSCWTCSPARWWAGPCARPCRRNQHWMRCAW